VSVAAEASVLEELAVALEAEVSASEDAELVLAPDKVAEELAEVSVSVSEDAELAEVSALDKAAVLAADLGAESVLASGPDKGDSLVCNDHLSVTNVH
jgi:hypothetical protein